MGGRLHFSVRNFCVVGCVSTHPAPPGISHVNQSPIGMVRLVDGQEVLHQVAAAGDV